MTTLLRLAVTVSLALIAVAAVAGTGKQADQPLGDNGAGSELIRSVPCTTVGTIWPDSATGNDRLRAPTLSVVRTDLRPKDVRLILDGRFIGRARYFNGKKGYLFLKPGRYRLELRLGGYRTEVFEIEAGPHCRFDIKHRMVRERGGAKETPGDPDGQGMPSQRVFGPMSGEPVPAATGPAGGPDRSLRPDIASGGRTVLPPPRRNASLDIEVQPANASVFLDGSYLATGEELDRMAAPLAIAAGRHVIEVRADGFVTRSVDFEVAAGEVQEFQISLLPEPPR